MYEEIISRSQKVTPDKKLKAVFKGTVPENCIVDAIYIDSSFEKVVGVVNLPHKVPVMMQIVKNIEIISCLIEKAGQKGSIAIVKDYQKGIKIYLQDGQVKELEIPSDIKNKIENVLSGVEHWAGQLNENGEHVIDLCTPSPAPHFYVNLLLGNRVGYPHALQTTPKSVVDRLGRGAFRSHAATQVLATRSDLRQEENGFPANRQFYILENYKKIFYSAEPNDSNIEVATCIHSQNHTRIYYKTKCGLEIERLIFILPQFEGMPLATEVQQIKITNRGSKARNLKVVYTGMFGSATPHAIFEDVLYSNIILQAKVLKDQKGNLIALGPDYYPEQCREDMRFHTTMIQKENTTTFPKEFCTNYNDFVGNGTLENPEFVGCLNNKLYRKGPSFFAVAGEFEAKPGENVTVNNFTGLVSKKVNAKLNDNTYQEEIRNLVDRFSKQGELEKIFEDNKQFFNRYSNFIQLQSSDDQLNTYFNKNLPFQVLYQTFVSRSFCQTQKGYREIGFREIQDIFASMYYFVSMGMSDFVKQMLKEWCSMIFEFGFAYHNFFWTGKEAGKWSDDALWFIQALYRYVNLSGDIGILDEQCDIAGTNPLRTRTIYETIQAVLRYSGEISVGKHGMPLLDNADWNDCLKLDNDFIDGIEKERRYKKQIEEGGTYGEPFKSDYSESIMNAFLLKVAIDEMTYLAHEKGDITYESKLAEASKTLYEKVQEHTWKGDFFARVLFNRYKNNEYTYLGAQGDNLSADPDLSGSYFLNSFNWSIIADLANEDQIETMLQRIESVLKTPYGIKLVSPTDLGKVANDTATGHYYPGDRENGGVFKHACMMATFAMFKAAKEVKNKALAEKLNDMGYWMVDLVLPYKTMEAPFDKCGNPRFCTQYNNSETGENIGPMLSGTSTWLILTLMNAFGVEYTRQGIKLNPIMRKEEKSIAYTINTGNTSYNVKVSKPKGFYRLSEGNAEIKLDGRKVDSNVIPLFEDKKTHQVEVIFK